MSSVVAELSDFSGRVVLVTGSAGGIGGGIADALAEAGATVIVADINEGGAVDKAAALTAAGHKADSIAIDIAEEASVVAACARIVEKHGAPWALINNAAVQDRQLLLEIDADEWDRVIRINSRGPMLMTREIARAMVATGHGGRIVNIASMSIQGQLLHGHTAYVTAKNSLQGLTRASALELAAHGITVNTLVPGGVITAGAATSKGPPMEGPGLRPPTLGMCESRDIAAALLFLISPAARFVTNQTLAVDAGWSLA
jgi:NAD(P)-dependent dehydrogenase (short-subunit alcohol dehydrogenase family)